jgi:hypothetical protein
MVLAEHFRRRRSRGHPPGRLFLSLAAIGQSLPVQFRSFTTRLDAERVLVDAWRQARAEGCSRRVDAMKPPLTAEQILDWADSHHQQTGTWPTYQSGAVGGVPGEQWGAIANALRRGLRGLPGGDTLPQLLERHRGRLRWQAERPNLWTTAEDELVCTLTVKEAAARTGRTPGAIRTRRYNLGVTTGRA